MSALRLRFPLVIVKFRDFAHRRIEPQIFKSELALLMTTRNLDPHEDLVRVNLPNRTALVGCVYIDVVAGF